MIRDYHVFAEPQEKSTRPVSASTDSRARAIWFAGLMAESPNWKKVWVQYGGKNYTPKQLGELP